MASAARCTEPNRWPSACPEQRWLLVGLISQCVWLCQGQRVIQAWPVSTAANGVGEQMGSGQTPRGWHIVRAKIGAQLPMGAVLRGRRWTHEVWSPTLHEQFPGRDWILTRILWLSGSERGRNRGGQVDTMRRYIYIHGTPDSEPMSVPLSHGCIRMRNTDVAELFELTPAFAPVWLDEQ